MTKYIIYACDDSNRQKAVKKMKRESEAINFVSDIRNLSEYGCMYLVKETDSDGRWEWNDETSVWERMDA